MAIRILIRRRTAARRGALVGALVVAAIGVTSAAFAAVVATTALPVFADGNAAVSTNPTPITSQTLVVSGLGTLENVPSYPGAGEAANYPDFAGLATDPRAVVSMANTTTVDALTPAALTFAFGADLNIDAINVGSSFDNGNNVIQRGLYGDKAQYKIELDGGYPACRVKGDRGNATIKSQVQVAPGSWYRVLCRRVVVATGDQLFIEVTPIDVEGNLGIVTRTTSRIVKIGKLSFAVSTRASIGGKLDRNGLIVGASDQFNGLIDNPVIDIG